MQWPLNSELSTTHLTFTTSLHYDYWHFANATCNVKVAHTLLHLSGEYNLLYNCPIGECQYCYILLTEEG